MRWLRRRPSASEALDAPEERPLFDDGFPALLERLALLAQRRFAGLLDAERRSRVLGSGLEFADHRAYAPGDDLRTMDWNVAARTGRLMIRRFEEEDDLFVHVAVDVSRSMRAGAPVSKRRRALRLAAALAYIGLVRHDRVGLVLLADGVEAWEPAARGRGRILRLLRFLEAAPEGTSTDLEAGLHQLTRRAPRRGLVVLLTDGYDAAGFQRGLARVVHGGHDAAVIRLIDQTELAPAAGGELEVIDAESGARRRLTLTPARAARLAEAHARHGAGLAAAATRLGVPYQERAVQEPFVETVLQALRGAGAVGSQHAIGGGPRGRGPVGRASR